MAFLFLNETSKSSHIPMIWELMIIIIYALIFYRPNEIQRNISELKRYSSFKISLSFA